MSDLVGLNSSLTRHGRTGFAILSKNIAGSTNLDGASISVFFFIIII